MLVCNVVHPRALSLFSHAPPTHTHTPVSPSLHSSVGASGDSLEQLGASPFFSCCCLKSIAADSFLFEGKIGWSLRFNHCCCCQSDGSSVMQYLRQQRRCFEQQFRFHPSSPITLLPPPSTVCACWMVKSPTATPFIRLAADSSHTFSFVARLKATPKLPTKERVICPFSSKSECFLVC